MTRVLIVGAGLGGLCLAQGLRQAGIEFAVFERDASADARAQGYRLHLDQRGDSALRECLPQPAHDRYITTRGQPSLGITTYSVDRGVLRPAGTHLFSDLGDSARPGPGWAVDRLRLRQALFAGIDDSVTFGKEVVRYTVHADSTVEAFFADGTSAVGDVLVAADGVGSRIRQQLLPHAVVSDIGLRWLGGKTLLTDDVRAALPLELEETFASVRMSTGEPTMLFGLVKFGATDEADQPRGYAFWGILGTASQLGIGIEDVDELRAPQLLAHALRVTADWPTALRLLVERCESERVFIASFRVARPIESWPTGRVTLLGDAIHVMPPSGSGANLALRDAALLGRALKSVESGDQSLSAALGGYEAEMLRVGFAAVRASIAPLASLGSDQAPPYVVQR